MRFKYLEKHLDFLRKGYKKMHIRDLTAAFNKKFRLKMTEGQIKSTLSNHKILCGRPYGKRLITQKRLLSAKQDRFVGVKYKNHGIKEVTKMLNEKFGTDFTVQQLKTYVHNNKINSGRTGQFEKGNINWNKGTKGLCKPNSGSFKKGDIPSNWRPIGSERICSKDGYILIKVEEWDHNFNRPTRWKQKHVHVWEQENGPVPDGFIVRFKDGDKLNVDPENLMLVSKALHLHLTRLGYNDAADELKPTILALARLEVKTFSIEKTI